MKRELISRLRQSVSKARKLARRWHFSVMAPWFPSIIFALLILVIIPRSSPLVDKDLLVGPSSFSQSAKASNPNLSPWNYFQPMWTTSDQGHLMGLWDTDAFIGWGMDAGSLVDDPAGVLESGFEIPEYLKGRVAFWVRVYSQYDSNIRIVHDRNQVELVYGIIDLRPLHRELGDSAIFEIRASQIEVRVVRNLQKLLIKSSNAGGSDSAGLRSLLSRFGALDLQAARQLSQGVRTQTGQRDMFLSALHRARELLPHIESVLRQYGLPITLARIPFVESSFNARAQSRIGAMGIWQFTPATAKEWIHADDESHWFDPIRQTKSAAKLLRGYRSVLPDWSTAITSYNSGVGRVRRLSQKYHANSLEKLLSIRENSGLGFAGKNFFAEVMAATIVEAYKEKLFGEHLLPENPSGVTAATSSTGPDRCE